jgi:hypothetical protein
MNNPEKEERQGQSNAEGPPEHGVLAPKGEPNREAKEGGLGHPISMLKA